MCVCVCVCVRACVRVRCSGGVVCVVVWCGGAVRCARLTMHLFAISPVVYLNAKHAIGCVYTLLHRRDSEAM